MDTNHEITADDCAAETINETGRTSSRVKHLANIFQKWQEGIICNDDDTSRTSDVKHKPSKGGKVSSGESKPSKNISTDETYQTVEDRKQPQIPISNCHGESCKPGPPIAKRRINNNGLQQQPTEFNSNSKEEESSINEGTQQLHLIMSGEGTQDCASETRKARPPIAKRRIFKEVRLQQPSDVHSVSIEEREQLPSVLPNEGKVSRPIPKRRISKEVRHQQSSEMHSGSIEKGNSDSTEERKHIDAQDSASDLQENNKTEGAYTQKADTNEERIQQLDLESIHVDLHVPSRKTDYTGSESAEMQIQQTYSIAERKKQLDLESSHEDPQNSPSDSRNTRPTIAKRRMHNKVRHQQSSTVHSEEKVDPIENIKQQITFDSESETRSKSAEMQIQQTYSIAERKKQLDLEASHEDQHNPPSDPHKRGNSTSNSKQNPIARPPSNSPCSNMDKQLKDYPSLPRTTTTKIENNVTYKPLFHVYADDENKTDYTGSQSAEMQIQQTYSIAERKKQLDLEASHEDPHNSPSDPHHKHSTRAKVEIEETYSVEERKKQLVLETSYENTPDYSRETTPTRPTRVISKENEARYKPFCFIPVKSSDKDANSTSEKRYSIASPPSHFSPSNTGQLMTDHVSLPRSTTNIENDVSYEPLHEVHSNDEHEIALPSYSVSKNTPPVNTCVDESSNPNSKRHSIAVPAVYPVFKHTALETTNVSKGPYNSAFPSSIYYTQSPETTRHRQNEMLNKPLADGISKYQDGFYIGAGSKPYSNQNATAIPSSYPTATGMDESSNPNSKRHSIAVPPSHSVFKQTARGTANYTQSPETTRHRRNEMVYKPLADGISKYQDGFYIGAGSKPYSNQNSTAIPSSYPTATGVDESSNPNSKRHSIAVPPSHSVFKQTARGTANYTQSPETTRHRRNEMVYKPLADGISKYQDGFYIGAGSKPYSKQTATVMPLSYPTATGVDESSKRHSIAVPPSYSVFNHIAGETAKSPETTRHRQNEMLNKPLPDVIGAGTKPYSQQNKTVVPSSYATARWTANGGNISESMNDIPNQIWNIPYDNYALFPSSKHASTNFSGTDQLIIKQLRDDRHLMKIQKNQTVGMAIEVIKNWLMIPRAVDVELLLNFTLLSNEQSLESVHGGDIIYILRHQAQRIVAREHATIQEDAIDPFTDEDRVLMSCGHATAPSNLYQYCWHEINNGSTDILCPALLSKGKCKKTWQFNEIKIKACLSQDEETLFSNVLDKNYFNKTKEIIKCSDCGIHLETFRDRLHFMCEHRDCRSRYQHRCKTCHLPWRDKIWKNCQNSECIKSRQCLQNQLLSCRIKDIVGVKYCPTIRACPKCFLLIQHDGVECKHMDCSNCKATFCFICLSIKEDGVYWPNSCGGAYSRCQVAPRQMIM